LSCLVWTCHAYPARAEPERRTSHRARYPAAEGEIESFEMVLLEPHGGELGGFILLRGDQDKLARIRTVRSSSGISPEACSQLSTSAW